MTKLVKDTMADFFQKSVLFKVESYLTNIKKLPLDPLIFGRNLAKYHRCQSSKNVYQR